MRGCVGELGLVFTTNKNKVYMEKIVLYIKGLFRVRYRLSVLYTGGAEVRHFELADGCLARRMAHDMEDICEYWTLYKAGPFHLPEHEVDCYMKGNS